MLLTWLLMERVAQSAPDRTLEPLLPRRVATFELVVFLILIVPSLVLSLFVIPAGGVGFTLTAVATILRDVALVALIRFFLWRNGEKTTRIGWRNTDVWREAVVGSLLFVPVYFGAAFVESVLLGAGLSTPANPPSFLTLHGGGEIALAILLVAVVAVAEETIFRGYLILRFTRATGSLPLAVILSSVIFSLGHGYEGSAGLVTVGLLGLAFALVYVWRGSLVAPMVMHFLQDLVGIVLVPLLRGHGSA